MHFKTSWINWRKVVIDNPKLSFGAKSMALYLNTYMNDSHDMAWPSIETIRGELSIGSRSTVEKYLGQLEKAGYIKKEKRFGNSTIYHAVVPVDISKSTKSVLVQDLGNSSTDSGVIEVQDLYTNNQKNNQFNKQSLNGAKKQRLFLSKENEKMKAFAIRNGFSVPRSGEEWDTYRNRLQGEIDIRNKENGYE